MYLNLGYKAAYSLIYGRPVSEPQALRRAATLILAFFGAEKRKCRRVCRWGWFDRQRRLAF